MLAIANAQSGSPARDDERRRLPDRSREKFRNISTYARKADAVSYDQETSVISDYGQACSTIQGAPLSSEEPRKVDAYWRARLYLSLGVLYLKENPLLREPLTLEPTKPRLLGHWGSDAAQSFTYTQFNRLINRLCLGS